MDESFDRFEKLDSHFRAWLGYSLGYKDETPWMHALYGVVGIFCPGFMSRYITVIGKTIYFPSREWLIADEHRAMQVLVHECTHLVDMRDRGMLSFCLGYLFPQVLVGGVLLAPWIGFWALGFLLFLLPLPAPFRANWEARAYAMDYLMADTIHRQQEIDWAVEQFSGWGYFRMQPNELKTREMILFWAHEIEAGREPSLTRLLLDYEFFLEQG